MVAKHLTQELLWQVLLYIAESPKTCSTELILWTEEKGIGNSVNISESFTSCFAYLWNMYLILEENYKYYCGSIFCGHCSLSVCIHVILLAGCVSNFRYKKRSSALFELLDEVSPYHILLPRLWTAAKENSLVTTRDQWDHTLAKTTPGIRSNEVETGTLNLYGYLGSQIKNITTVKHVAQMKRTKVYTQNFGVEISCNKKTDTIEQPGSASSCTYIIHIHIFKS